MGMILGLLLFPAFSHALPPSDIVQWVQRSLRPGITVKSVGPQGAACSPTNLMLSGKDPFTGLARDVQAAIYTPAGSAQRDVIVMPPTGGENYIDRAYAAALCAAGLRATILQHWENDSHRDADLSTYDMGSLRTLAAAEHMLEYLNPTKPAAILGTSLGALGAAFVLGYDARITMGVMIVGGDHLNEIIARSTEQGVAQIRDLQMKANHIATVDEFEKALGEAIHVDPGTFADFTGKKSLSMYIATEDTTVPTKNQLDLLAAFGASSPRVDSYAGSHFTTIVHTYWYHEGDIVSYLAGRTVKNEPKRFAEIRQDLGAGSW